LCKNREKTPCRAAGDWLKIRDAQVYGLIRTWGYGFWDRNVKLSGDVVSPTALKEHLYILHSGGVYGVAKEDTCKTQNSQTPENKKRDWGELAGKGEVKGKQPKGLET